MTFTTLTITRAGQSITLPVYMDEVLADVGGDLMPVMAPYLTLVGAERALELVGVNVEQQMQYLFIDGDGITSFDGEDYSYSLT